MIIASGSSDIGCVRAANEDRILVESDKLVFVVADGMGGERCGGRAAELATLSLNECFRVPMNEESHMKQPPDPNGGLKPSQERMASAIRLANERILRESEITAECDGMGCTISAVAVHDNVATIGSVGDSRVYLYRARQLFQLTRDDSVLADLLASGTITPEEAPTHPMRNMLTQSVGRHETVAVQIMEFSLLNGDRLMVSSDGLHGIIDSRAIEEILATEAEPESAVRQLIAGARSRGGPDNISCIVIDYQ
jgi:protein phosphatase